MAEDRAVRAVSMNLVVAGLKRSSKAATFLPNVPSNDIPGIVQHEEKETQHRSSQN